MPIFDFVAGWAMDERMTFEYIEVFYNRIRRHAKMNNQIPAQFAQAWLTQQHKMQHNSQLALLRNRV